ncbi:hypothetical protein C0992_004669 [Termitomyces sp. T32_za158]|nr:hypothetical protein C0992_004669 [Termitomyces sp. T32_za158]
MAVFLRPLPVVLAVTRSKGKLAQHRSHSRSRSPPARSQSSVLSDPPCSPPVLLSRLSSASSSGSSDCLLASSLHSSIMPSPDVGGFTAEVTQVSASHAPVIGRGLIGPKQLDAFEHGAKRYFSHKGIEDDKQVGKIMYNIDSSEVKAWIREKETELMGLTFAVFMAKLRGVVLSSDWEWEVVQVLSKKQGEDERFLEWVTELREANDILITKKRFYIPPDRLCDHILLHCHDDVRREYALGNKDGCYDDIKEFHAWIQKLSDIDRVIAARKSQISKYIASSLASSTKNHLKTITNVGKGSAGKQTEQKTQVSAVASSRVIVYPLTEEERGLIRNHSSCFRCCKLYAGHRAADCPDGDKPLTMEEYLPRKLTPEFAAAAQAVQAKKMSAKSGSGVVTVAAVFGGSSDSEDSSDGGDEYVIP